MQRTRKPLLICFLWALAIGWIAVLFYFSGQSGVDSGNLSRRLTNFVLRCIPSLPLSADRLEFLLRKLAHFGIFAVEGFLLALAVMETTLDLPLGALLTGVACTAMAAANEMQQLGVAGRSCEGRDVFIDAGGALLGVLAAMLLLRLAHRSWWRAEKAPAPRA